MTTYIADHDKSRIQLEVSGYFAKLSDGTYFVAGDADVKTVGELINACGYTAGSVLNRRIVISIDEEL